MKQIIKLFLVVMMLLLLSVLKSNAQMHIKNNELGVEVGPVEFLGELGGRNDIGRGFIYDFEFKSLRQMLGVFYKYELTPHWKLNLGFKMATLSGNDANINAGPGDPGFARKYRNLSFKSNIQEVAVDLQYNFLEHMYKFNKKRSIYPFVFSGLGMFHQNPKALYNGQWVALQPLGTEGQGLPQYPNRKKYSNIQGFWSAGAGIKFMFNANWSLSLSMNYRMTTTDYMDDVSKTYADPKYFNNPTAAALSVRSSEAYPDGQYANYTVPGQQRGDPTQYDTYFYPVAVGMVYNMQGYGNYGYAKNCPSFGSLKKGMYKPKRSYRNKNKKHISCPAMID